MYVHTRNVILLFFYVNLSILVMWMRCRLLDTEIDGLSPALGISMFRPSHLVRIVSVYSAVKGVPDGNTVVKRVCSVLCAFQRK